MLLIQTPGAVERRDQIEAAMTLAITAGGDRAALDHEWSLLDTAIAAFMIAAPQLVNAVLIGYIRGYANQDPAHYVRQAKGVLQIGQSMGQAGLCQQLGERLDRFVALRNEQPEVANYYFKAVTYLLESTVGMANHVE